MGVKEAVNAALRRTTGLQLTRAPTGAVPAGLPPETRPGDRMLERPAFILSCVRSGSTLLRVLLDSHSQLCSPHELHLRDIRVRYRTRRVAKSMDELGLDPAQLEYLLWDRLLHRELGRRGKRYLVNKTPNDVFMVERIRECWPDARFIYLFRHPGSIARSRAAARPQDSEERNVSRIRRYSDAIEQARAAYPGHIVRYESLTADPAGELRELCAFLDVPYEPQMLEYDRFDHGRYRVGLGDWTERIRSGRIQEAPPPPEHVPDGLRDLVRAWGYEAGQLAPPQR